MGTNRIIQTGSGLALLALCGLAGCSAPSTEQAPRFTGLRPSASDQDASRLVLSSDIVLSDPDSGWGLEASRRDRALAVGLLDGDLAVPAFYEGEIPPNLWETRRLYLDRDPRHVLYFQPGYDRRQESRRYWY